MSTAFSDLKKFRDLIQESGIRVASKDRNLTELANELKRKSELTPFTNNEIVLRNSRGSLLTDIVIAVPVLYDKVDGSESMTKEELIEEKTELVFQELAKRFPIVWPGNSVFKASLTSDLGSRSPLVNLVIPAYLISVTLGREYGHCPMTFE